MSGQITATSTMSIELVAALVGISMLAGAIDLCRQPGWAWRLANESKAAYLILVVLLPLIGLGMYVFRARPTVVAAAEAGRATTTQPDTVATAPEPLAITSTQPSVATSEGPPRSTSGSTSAPTSLSTPATTRGPVPSLVSANRSAADARPAAGEAFGFASFEEVAALSEHPNASPPAVAPIKSIEISSTFFSSEATRTVRPPRLRSRSKPQLTLVATADSLVSAVPAGWKPDPTRNHQFRYWDGVNWTENIADNGSQSRDTAGT